MSQAKQSTTDIWVRWDWLWQAIFTTFVILPNALMLFDDNRVTPAWVPILLSALMLVWHWVGLRIAYRGNSEWDEKPIPRFIIILGDIALWGLLITISPAYYFVLFGLFSQVFRHLPIRYAIVATFILTGMIIWAETLSMDGPISLTNPTLWIFGLMGIGGIVLGLWISAIIQQSTRRRELIEQLEQTQAELAAAERREGTLEERQRLAREIHDTLAQGFTSIVMHLEAADQAMPNELDTVQTHLDQARRTARTSLDQARRVVQDLRPDLLERQSLPEAIRRTAVRWSQDTAVTVHVNTTGTTFPLHPDIEVTLLRATQEALSNIRKHALAQEVIITLSYMADIVILDVQDDGVGLNGAAPSPFSGGFGLQGMRERAAQFNGEVIVESEPGEGTTLVLSIPIDAGQSDSVGEKERQ